MGVVAYTPLAETTISVYAALALGYTPGANGVEIWVWLESAPENAASRLILNGNTATHLVAKNFVVPALDTLYIGVHSLFNNIGDLVSFSLESSDVTTLLEDVYDNSVTSDNPIVTPEGNWSLGYTNGTSIGQLGSTPFILMDPRVGHGTGIYRYGQWGWIPDPWWPFVSRDGAHPGLPNTTSAVAMAKYSLPHPGPYQARISGWRYSAGLVGDGEDMYAWIDDNLIPAATLNIDAQEVPTTFSSQFTFEATSGNSSLYVSDS